MPPAPRAGWDICSYIEGSTCCWTLEYLENGYNIFWSQNWLQFTRELPQPGGHKASHKAAPALWQSSQLQPGWWVYRGVSWTSCITSVPWGRGFGQVKGCHILKATFLAVLQQLFLTQTPRDQCTISLAHRNSFRFIETFNKKEKGFSCFSWALNGNTDFVLFLLLDNNKQISVIETFLFASSTPIWQTDLVNSPVCPLPTVEQGLGSPATMPRPRRVTLGKSLHPLPGFLPILAGRREHRFPRGSECLSPCTAWLSTEALHPRCAP